MNMNIPWPFLLSVILGIVVMIVALMHILLPVDQLVFTIGLTSALNPVLKTVRKKKDPSRPDRKKEADTR